ncbi:hypothetical protein PaG_04534 [Moesziomyces aphidis]|uniref:Metallo-beta-lactamase domain-containing protein n=1 Tax=Moesziomyces aphidis TaxID=84754 RepID=W3VIG8_MOEAP|nr:hypothetical protein PaG_04534 [Moesziomyces aphidis]
MCYGILLGADLHADFRQIPASARVDPSSLPFHRHPTGSETAAVAVTLFHLGSVDSYRQVWADDAWDGDHGRRCRKAEQRVELPILSALIEHEDTGEKWLWDLGMCNDFDVLPTAFSNGSVKAITPRLSDRGQLKNVLLDLFNVNSIEEVGLTGIFLSHAHVDHYGNLLDFPNAVPVFVGSGTLGWIGGGEDAAKRGEAGHLYFPSSFLKDRVFIEMHDVESKADDVVKARVRQTKVGPFDRAWDWFGDGSVVIASAEGHCHGHIVLLARTSPGPRPSYVLLSGDAAHQQALYHPLPPPLELDGELLSGPGDVTSSYSTTYGAEHDQRATPGFFDSQSSEAITDRLVPDGEATCMQEFPDKAMRTIAALSRMEACADVMVILAHEIEFAESVGLREGSRISVNGWREKGYKEGKIETGKRAREFLESL